MFEVYRVVTEIRDHRGKRIVEAGPWLTSKGDAENWAEILRDLGYKAHIERMNGGMSDDEQSNDDFANALAGMA